MIFSRLLQRLFSGESFQRVSSVIAGLEVRIVSVLRTVFCCNKNVGTDITLCVCLGFVFQLVVGFHIAVCKLGRMQDRGLGAPATWGSGRSSGRLSYAPAGLEQASK